MFDDGQMVLEAVAAGVGIGYMMESRAAEAIKSGKVVRILAEWCPPFPGFYLYYPGRRQVSAALAAFIEAIRVKPSSARPSRSSRIPSS